MSKMLLTLCILLGSCQPSYNAINTPEIASLVLSEHQVVVISKEHEMLYLYRDGNLSSSFPVATGRNAGDKQAKGDMRTPEGVFTICSHNPNSDFNLSLGLSYPEAEDAERGYKAKLISLSQKRVIENAIKQGKCPPWNTKLGGSIMIHGGGYQKFKVFKRSTLGCIAMHDPDMQELFTTVPNGTKVVIH